MKRVFFYLIVSSVVLLADFTRDDAAETVVDNTTSLMWQDDASPVMMKWDDALKYCENLDLSSFDDWKLPNKSELDSLVDAKRSDPAISSEFKNIYAYRYWSSTERSGAKAAWYVNFSYGHKDGFYKTDKNHVRCVRKSVKVN